MTARTRTAPSSRPGSNTDTALRSLAEKLVRAEAELARKAGDLVSLIEEVKAEMRKTCPEGGKYKWEFPGQGEVSLAGKREAEFKGLMPEVVAETFLGLTESRRQKLIDDGVVKMSTQYGSPFHGRVTVKLF